MTPPPSHTSTRYLVGPRADFWLLGGASIVFWIILSLAYLLRHSLPWVEPAFSQYTYVSKYGLIYLANYPHFMLSYRYAYSRGSRFIARHWFSLVAVPISLVGLFALTFVTQRSGGPNYLPLAGSLMFLTVGWHYSRQIFGCVMTYSRYDAYPLSSKQRSWILWSLLSLWVSRWIQHNVSHPTPRYEHIPNHTLGLPYAFTYLGFALVFVTTLGVLTQVWLKNLEDHRRHPSPNLAISWIAFLVWWTAPAEPRVFGTHAVPLFHCVQYLTFVYRREGRSLNRNTLLVYAVSILAGVTFFEWAPGSLDRFFGTQNAEAMGFFALSFVIFLNIHHYFIDSVAWKLRDPGVRSQLI